MKMKKEKKEQDDDDDDAQKEEKPQLKTTGNEYEEPEPEKKDAPKCDGKFVGKTVFQRNFTADQQYNALVGMRNKIIDTTVNKSFPPVNRVLEAYYFDKKNNKNIRVNPHPNSDNRYQLYDQFIKMLENPTKKYNADLIYRLGGGFTVPKSQH